MITLSLRRGTNAPDEPIHALPASRRSARSVTVGAAQGPEALHKPEAKPMPEATFPPIQVPGKGALYARFVTSMGNVVIKLEEERAPKTVKNFVGLATGTQEWKDPRTGETKKGVPYYDGTIFHRCIPDFMALGGDPLGRGTGGPGYKFADEFHPELRHDVPGVL